MPEKKKKSAYKMQFTVDFSAVEPLIELWAALEIVDQLKEDYPHLKEVADQLRDHIKKAEAGFCEALNAKWNSGSTD